MNGVTEVTGENKPQDRDIFSVEDYLDDPGFSTAYANAEVRSHLLADLVAERKSTGMRQVDVAKAMQTASRSSRTWRMARRIPHLSTLQRYASAVSVRLVLRLDLPGVAEPERTMSSPEEASVEKPAL